MDAHDLHPAGGASRRHRRLLPCLQEKPQVADKAEQPLVSRPLKGFGVLVQGDQVFPPPLPVGHGAEYAQNIQPVVQQPHQPLHAQVLCQRAQLPHQPQKRLAVRIPAGLHRVVKAARRVFAPDHRQPVRCKAHQRRAQHRDQRYVLPGVIQNLQQRVDHRHLHSGKEVLVLLRAAGNAPLCQRPGIVAQPGAGGAHQDHDILRPAGPQAACRLVRYRIPLVQQTADPFCRESGLRQGAGQRRLLPAPVDRNPQQMELRLAAVPLRQIAGAEVQPLRLSIVDLPHFLGHNRAEDVVHRVQHRLAGAEVLAEQNLSRPPLPGVFHVGIGVVLVQENSRVRQAEAVDRLLYVPYGKEILSAAGNGVKYAVLHLVGVLVLVHHDLPVPPCHDSRQLCGRAVLPQQQMHREVLLIGKVRHIPPQLLLLVRRRKRAAQRQQRLHGRRGAPQVLRRFRRRHVQDGAGPVHLCFGPVPDALHPVLQLRRAAFPRRRQPGPAHRLSRRRVPALLRGRRQPCKLLRRLPEAAAVGLVQSAVLRHQRQALLQHGRPVPGLPPQIRQQLAAIGGLSRILRHAGPALPLLRQPTVRVGMALQLAVEVQHQLLQAAVVPTKAEGVRQLQGPR